MTDIRFHTVCVLLSDLSLARTPTPSEMNNGTRSTSAAKVIVYVWRKKNHVSAVLLFFSTCGMKMEVMWPFFLFLSLLSDLHPSRRRSGSDTEPQSAQIESKFPPKPQLAQECPSLRVSFHFPSSYFFSASPLFLLATLTRQTALYLFRYLMIYLFILAQVEQNGQAS